MATEIHTRMSNVNTGVVRKRVVFRRLCVRLYIIFGLISISVLMFLFKSTSAATKCMIYSMCSRKRFRKAATWIAPANQSSALRRPVDRAHIVSVVGTPQYSGCVTRLL